MQHYFIYFHVSLKCQYFWSIGILKIVCYYKLMLFLFLRMFPNVLRHMLVFIIRSAPSLLIPFCSKVLPTDVVYRSLQAALICASSDLGLIRQKMKGAKIMLVFIFIPTLYIPVIVNNLPRDSSGNWIMVVFPLHIFT